MRWSSQLFVEDEMAIFIIPAIVNPAPTTETIAPLRKVHSTLLECCLNSPRTPLSFARNRRFKSLWNNPPMTMTMKLTKNNLSETTGSEGLQSYMWAIPSCPTTHPLEANIIVVKRMVRSCELKAENKFIPRWRC